MNDTVAALTATVTIEGETEPRVAFTQEALELVLQLRDQHGPLMFHQSGGCCDGSSPMCYPLGDFITSDADVLLGEFAVASDTDSLPIPFYMSTEQFAYWKHTFLTVDVVPGRGSGFSLEAPEGKRFLIRSRLMES
ncbi:DUF779 domain-containing protein [Lysinibacter cavernae]|uniref:DUF779 domain-containing protein n=1 Tax=Lysinibacter cavernae TaxID=1640652 RepID=A0A7X5TSE6_9MICO|nr:DUF779 domain-containing protein [Lysinibacter cavernae]NIH53421.1 hypothetical protein [Lysinibacter cavernae]